MLVLWEDKMGKISPVAAKYIIHADIEIDGVVDRSDVIGAIFGQTEGLLGNDLELRELQRSGRIGRIEVNVETRTGKTKGAIIIPSSLDKAESCIIGAALETIQRIGPCNSRVKVKQIEDVRISKRKFIIDRAKQLLKEMLDNVIPDSKELSDEVSASVRMMELQKYGKDRLPAGPDVKDSDEIIIVEGRADVLNLLKHGFKNAIAMNGTNVPETIIELSKHKTTTAFVDGDRGGSLILSELLSVAEIDYVTMAPDGKEAEEITKKEIHKALRSKISAAQAKLELGLNDKEKDDKKQTNNRFQMRKEINIEQKTNEQNKDKKKEKKELNKEEKRRFKELAEDLLGTRGVYLLDNKLNILAKIPLGELITTLKNTQNIFAVILDGTIDRNINNSAEKSKVEYLIGMSSRIKNSESKINILTLNNL